MTENKRFYVDKSGDFRDKQTGNIIVDFGYSLNAMECKMILDLLNELHDEKQLVIKWIDRKIEEIKPYNSELCRATLLELKEFLE